MTKLYSAITICLLAILLINCRSELVPISNAYTVSVNSGDTTVSFQVQGIDEEPKINDEVIYTWYKSNKIFASQGGYSGQLLHGRYEEFVAKRLVRKGSFENGMRVGQWRSWNKKGDLRTIVSYKKGLKNGAYKLYQPAGQLKEYGSLKAGKRSGKIVFIYPNDSLLAIKYQAGLPKDTVSVKTLGLF